jgi:acyl carrier protein
VHAAGLLDDRTIPDITEQQFTNPMLPKIFGGFNMHDSTRHMPLDFFVAYSSASAQWGSAGQTNYAAANAFLNALCRARVADGLPGISIQWGTFANVGLATTSTIRGKRLASRGSDDLLPEEGNAIFGWLLDHPKAEVGIARANIAQAFEFFPHLLHWPYLAELVTQSSPKEDPAQNIVAKIRAAHGAQREIILEQYVLEHVGRVLGLDASEMDRHARFSALGMDSLMSLEFRNRLGAALSLELPATLIFTYPTPLDLIVFLMTQIVPPSAIVAESAITVPDLVPNVATPDILPVETPQANPPLPLSLEAEVEAKIEAKLNALAKYLD